MTWSISYLCHLYPPAELPEISQIQNMYLFMQYERLYLMKVNTKIKRNRSDFNKKRTPKTPVYWHTK